MEHFIVPEWPTPETTPQPHSVMIADAMATLAAAPVEENGGQWNLDSISSTADGLGTAPQHPVLAPWSPVSPEDGSNASTGSIWDPFADPAETATVVQL